MAASRAIAAAEKATGYVVGGISPLGQTRRLSTAIDDVTTAYETMFVSAGRVPVLAEATAVVAGVPCPRLSAELRARDR